MDVSTEAALEAWPSLPFDAWHETCETLHRWFQIVGKVRLVQSPWVNHGWHVTLYVTATGLTTSSIPYGNRVFQIDFDFGQHRLSIRASDGRSAGFTLEPQSVATFYTRLMQQLATLGLQVKIHPKPNEVADACRFDQDQMHCAYDPDYANRFWRVLLQADRIFKEFRARFGGKCSPIHFFWGAPDLAVTRFSGRTAPIHPGGIPNLPDWVTREAYSHELSSCGLWAGSAALPYAAFYSYAYPEPAGFATAPIKPAAAVYNTDFREFILPYNAVRQTTAPDAMLLDFLQSTYDAAANLAQWDRHALECGPDPRTAA